MIKANIKQYELANYMGIAEQNFSRKLRYELTDEEKARVLKAIKELEKGGKQQDKRAKENSRTKIDFT